MSAVRSRSSKPTLVRCKDSSKGWWKFRHVIIDELAIPALQAPRHALANTAHANHTHGLVRKFVGLRDPRTPDISGPLTILHRLELQMHFAIDTDHQSDRMFRDRDCIAATVVGDLDVQLVQRRNVDHVRARTEPSARVSGWDI